MARIRIIAAVLALILSLGSTACGKQNSSEEDTTAGGMGSQQNSVLGENELVETGNADNTASAGTAPVVSEAEEPTVGSYEAGTATVITLADTPTITGEGASAEGRVVTIHRAGTYVFSGSVVDGQIVVDTEDTSKVILVLNGASLSCASGPAILVLSAPKRVVIHTAKGSVNLLADGAGYVVPDEERVDGQVYPNACLYACDDLELTGEGQLQITGRADKGINTKDDLKITGGSILVRSVGIGIRANDSLEMSAGQVTVTAGADGIKTANVEIEGKGSLSISGGELYVTAQGDGLSAATDLTVSGGTLVLTTTDTDGVVLPESSGNPTSGSTGGMGRFGGWGGGRPGESFSDKASISAKGLKAEGNIAVLGGQITIVAQDDGIHATGNITVQSGTLHIRAADDGMHADKDLTITGGVTEIAQSYEGLEALHITIKGGTNRITASDDGANAADGSSSGMGGGFGGGRPGMWGSSSGSVEFSEEQPCLTFAGGYTVFNAAGDGIDSNGWIKMTGGTVIVYGPTDNGNGPIDHGDGGYTMTISGGTLLAVGSSGMAESPENEGQAVVAAYWNRTGLSAGDKFGIVDAGGKLICAFELPKSIASVVFSSPEIVAGNSYSIVSGGAFTGTATDGVIDISTYSGYESLGDIEAY